MNKLFLGLIAVIVIVISSLGTANARNYPCSGSKGGIDRCDGGQFICNDGSTSRSEQVCTVDLKNSINSKAGVAGASVSKPSSKPSVTESIKTTSEKANKKTSEKIGKASDDTADKIK
ncbi:MAG: cell envelope biogenesis protein TolA, partial [Providencia sp.]